MADTVERVTPGTRSWDEYGEEHIQRYAYFSGMYKDKSVIDAACGTGYGSSYIAANGAKKVLAIDLSNEAVLFAKQKYQDNKIEFKQFDCMKLNELNTSCDLAVSFETIEHLPDPEQFIKNMAHVLAPGGIFICSTPNKARLSGAGHINPFHPSELPWTDFKTIFGKYFNITATYQQSESVAYLRYMEVKHLLHQEHARNNSFIMNRTELFFRKLFKKDFKPIPFFHEKLLDQHKNDMVIEPFEQAENWHKTFIIVGRVKK